MTGHEDVEARLRRWSLTSAWSPDSMITDVQRDCAEGADSLADMRRQRDQAIASRDSYLKYTQPAVLRRAEAAEEWLGRVARELDCKAADDPAERVKLLRADVDRLTRERDQARKECDDACETAKERRDEAYLLRVRAEAAEAQLAEARAARDEERQRYREEYTKIERLKHERDEALTDLEASEADVKLLMHEQVHEWCKKMLELLTNGAEAAEHERDRYKALAEGERERIAAAVRGLICRYTDGTTTIHMSRDEIALAILALPAPEEHQPADEARHPYG
jgi:chromosome segregation ATPase